MRRSRWALWTRRLVHPLYRSLETDVHPLRYLFVEVTQRCNLACLHCGSDCGRDTQRDELTVEEWLGFFDRLRASFDPRRVVLVVTGGEPLCHPRLFELLERLRRNGQRWGMVTNGYHLDAGRLQRLVELGLESITVSLDGLQASHDHLRGRHGSFDRAVRAIEHLVATRMRRFDVVTCVYPRNLDELPRMLPLLRRLGVPAWRLFTIFPRGRARDNAALALSDHELRHLAAWTRAARARLARDDIRLNFSCEGYLPATVDRALRDEPYFCRAGISIGSVLCDGAISACPNITRALVQGNIRQDDFATVWNNRFQRFRNRSWMRTGPCVACAHWSRCLGNSMHLWDDTRGHTARCHMQALGSWAQAAS